MGSKDRLIVNFKEIYTGLTKFVFELDDDSLDDFFLAGIGDQGVYIGELVQGIIQKLYDRKVPLGIVDLENSSLIMGYSGRIMMQQGYERRGGFNDYESSHITQKKTIHQKYVDKKVILIDGIVDNNPSNRRGIGDSITEIVYASLSKEPGLKYFKLLALADPNPADCQRLIRPECAFDYNEELSRVNDGFKGKMKLEFRFIEGGSCCVYAVPTNGRRR